MIEVDDLDSPFLQGEIEVDVVGQDGQVLGWAGED
jgi:hypothetical protein